MRDTIETKYFCIINEGIDTTLFVSFHSAANYCYNKQLKSGTANIKIVYIQSNINL